jgi:nucleoside-diphosphate-sugar epimerase
MTTYLILGGNGFLGSHLAAGLVNKGYDVRVFNSSPTEMANLKTIKGKIEILKGDFLNLPVSGVR